MCTRIRARTIIMFALAALLTSSALLIGLCSALFNPYAEGPHDRKTLVVGIRHHEDLEFELRVSAPVAEGNFPALYFLGGFHMNVPNFVYDDLLDRVASFGVVVVSLWRFTIFGDDETATTRLNRAIAWVERDLANELKKLECPFDLHCPDDGWTPFPDGFSVRSRGFYVSGHSSGGPDIVRVVLNQTAEHGDEAVAGIFLMSPVDGGDPWGVLDDFVTPEAGQLPFNVPSVVLMAGLDSVPGQNLPLYPACAPDALSNTRFYNAMSGPKWFNNATDFGHGDVTSDFFAWFIWFTGICKGGDNSLDKRTYRNWVAGQAAAFISAVEDPEQNCDMIVYLEETDTMLQANVVAFHDYDGNCPLSNRGTTTRKRRIER